MPRLSSPPPNPSPPKMRSYPWAQTMPGMPSGRSTVTVRCLPKGSVPRWALPLSSRSQGGFRLCLSIAMRIGSAFRERHSTSFCSSSACSIGNISTLWPSGRLNGIERCSSKSEGWGYRLARSWSSAGSGAGLASAASRQIDSAAWMRLCVIRRRSASSRELRSEPFHSCRICVSVNAHSSLGGFGSVRLVATARAMQATPAIPQKSLAFPITNILHCLNHTQAAQNANGKKWP